MTPAASGLAIRVVTGDSPQDNLRKLEWAIWEILGDIAVQDAGPRYESAEFLATHLHVNGFVICD